MRLLITNDDGIDAEGLAALRRAAARFGEATVVAPERCHSSCSHTVTTERPLELRQVDPDLFALDGSPADCVRIGLTHLLPDVDWVLAGINHGGNLGADVHLSGTVAAVREAALFGRCGIAFSHYRRRGKAIDWNQAGVWVGQVLAELFAAEKLPPGRFWNVNLPHPDELPVGDGLPARVICPLDPNPLPIRFEAIDEGGRRTFKYNANYHERLRRGGSDVDTCFGGKISITEVRL